MKKLIILGFLMLTLAFLACEDGYIPPFSSPSDPPSGKIPEQNSVPSNSAGPSTSSAAPQEQYQIWYASYVLPGSWQINKDNPNKARRDNPGQATTYLEISRLENFSGQQQLRQMAENLRNSLASCQTGQSEGIGPNCSLPLYISDLQIAGYDSVVFRYYGTWLDHQQEVNEIFLNWRGVVVHLSLICSLSSVHNDLQILLNSLNWEQKIPQQLPVQEPEEKGL